MRSLRIGTEHYPLPAKATLNAPTCATVGKTLVDSIKVGLLYGGTGTIKVTVRCNGSEDNWQFRMPWAHVHAIRVTGLDIAFEFVKKMLVWIQRGKDWMSSIDDVDVAQNMSHAAHVTITADTTDDVSLVVEGLKAIGKAGSSRDALNRVMHEMQSLDNVEVHARRIAVDEGQSKFHAMRSFLKGERSARLACWRKWYRETLPGRMRTGPYRMKKNSGMRFYRECRACIIKCRGCEEKRHLVVWVMEDGKLIDELGHSHDQCKTTKKEPRLQPMLSESCACGDAETRMNALITRMNNS